MLTFHHWNSNMKQAKWAVFTPQWRLPIITTSDSTGNQSLKSDTEKMHFISKEFKRPTHQGTIICLCVCMCVCAHLFVCGLFNSVYITDIDIGQTGLLDAQGVIHPARCLSSTCPYLLPQKHDSTPKRSEDNALCHTTSSFMVENWKSTHFTNNDNYCCSPSHWLVQTVKLE